MEKVVELLMIVVGFQTHQVLREPQRRWEGKGSTVIEKRC